MGSSLADRSALHEKGVQSVFYQQLLDMECDLTDEQAALMALIWENMPPTIPQEKLIMFAKNVQYAQSLMPSGTIRSKQILVTIAMMNYSVTPGTSYGHN